MDNPDFRFEGFLQPDGRLTPTPSPGAVHKTNLAAPVNVAEPIMQAAKHRHRIEQLAVEQWKGELAAIEDEDVRTRCRAMLVKVYEERKARQERETVRRRRETPGGKRSAAGDAALAELSKKYGSAK